MVDMMWLGRDDAFNQDDHVLIHTNCNKTTLIKHGRDSIWRVVKATGCTMQETPYGFALDNKASCIFPVSINKTMNY